MNNNKRLGVFLLRRGPCPRDDDGRWWQNCEPVQKGMATTDRGGRESTHICMCSWVRNRSSQTEECCSIQHRSCLSISMLSSSSCLFGECIRLLKEEVLTMFVQRKK